MKEYFNKLYKGSKNDFYDLVKKNLISNKRMFVVTANPETLMTAENNSNFRNTLLDSNTTIIADGIGIIKGAKMLGYSLPGTIPGVELCSELFKYCNDLNKSIFLFGATEEIIEKLVSTIHQKYPNVTISGYENGYVSDKQVIFQKIKDLKSIRLKNVKSAPCYMPEERKTRLQDNLNHNESITTITYTKLNTCLRYQATADLKKHIKEELLCRIGSSTHVTYLLAKND
mgnify:CR=1 FL=1